MLTISTLKQKPEPFGQLPIKNQGVDFMNHYNLLHVRVCFLLALSFLKV